MRRTSACESAIGWQSGISAEVCFAAMIPASRAVCSGSPFLLTPDRTWRSASADILMWPRATASRAVAGLAETSTIRMRPFSSTWDSFLLTIFPLHQEEREALERDGQVHVPHF